MLGVITLTAILIWSVVTIALAYLGGMLMSPAQPEVEEEVEGAQSRLWRPHTTQQEGLARPRAYGKNLHHGNILAKWTDVADNREILYILLNNGDGPTKGVVSPIADNVFLNDQPASNFTAVALQERLGTMNQTCMTGFEKPKLEKVLNIPLIYNESIIYTTPNDFFDDLEFTIIFPNGLRRYRPDGSRRSSCGLTLKVRISPHGENDWTNAFYSLISDSTSEPKFINYKISALLPGYLDPATQYDIEFTNLSAGGDRIIDDVSVRSVREVISTAFTHPGKALVGIRAVATSQLSGNIDVKIIREDRIINTYDGSSWTLQYSNNRAWVAWDIATLPAIDGDGDGTPYAIARYDGIGPQYLDLEFFYAWSQFCGQDDIPDGYGGVENRSDCNTIVDEFTSIFAKIQEIAASGRANIYWQGHQLTGWIDDVVTTPIDLVTMDSIMAKTWKNAWAISEELMGVAEVFYKDEKLGFERTPADWASEDAGGFRNIVSFEGVGIITRGAAVHYANYLLERNHLIRNINKFQVHKDGFRYKLGEVIKLQCRVANWGKAFRVVSSTADTITVDRNTESEVNAGDVIHIRTYDTILKTVVTDTYEVDSISGQVITATVNWDVTPIKGNLVAVGASGDIKLRRITKLLSTTDNYFNVEVETYDVDLFDADNLDPENPNANFIWPGPAGISNPPITREEVVDLITDYLPPQPDIEIPWPSNLTWTGSGGDTVTWSKTEADDELTFRLKGTSHIITPDSTTLKYIYWDPGSPTVFLSTNVLATAIASMQSGGWMVCINTAGVVGSAVPFQIIHGALIQAGTIIAGHIDVGTLSAISAALGTITSGSITITLTGNKKLRISNNGIQVTNDGGSNWRDFLVYDGEKITLSFDLYDSGDVIKGVGAAKVYGSINVFDDVLTNSTNVDSDVWTFIRPTEFISDDFVVAHVDRKVQEVSIYIDSWNDDGTFQTRFAVYDKSDDSLIGYTGASNPLVITEADVDTVVTFNFTDILFVDSGVLVSDEVYLKVQAKTTDGGDIYFGWGAGNIMKIDNIGIGQVMIKE